MTNPFQDRKPLIENNERIRAPQKGVFLALNELFAAGGEEREFAVILPVGCGKSGSITISPFAFRSRRTLVVAPGVAIAQQLVSDFDPSNPNMFYRSARCSPAPPILNLSKSEGRRLTGQTWTRRTSLLRIFSNSRAATQTAGCVNYRLTTLI
ncbi:MULTISPECIES: hypothetical protein [unclassified Pseudomonas]|uniref:hypothetical protein n=1 Tax=unclassified Pseudomonas TaxID=196821 RepID=UPI001C473063|nr:MULTISPECIES: hypothetical protein [unclassified Pseudomonas]